MSVKLRTALIVTFIALSLLLSFTLSTTINYYSSQSIKNEIGESLAGTAYQTADKLDNFMWSRSGEVELLGSLPVFENNQNVENIQQMLDQLKSHFPSFSWIGYTDTKGKVLAATDGILLGKDLSERPVFKEGIQGKFIGDVHDAVLLAKLLPNPTGEPLQFVDVSLPIKNSQQQTIGVLAAHMSWAWAKEVQQSVLLPSKWAGQNVDMLIVSKKDQTVLLGPREMVGKPLPLKSIAKAQLQKDGWELEKWPDGNTYLTGYAYGDGYLDYPGLGWTVIVRQPESTALASVSELMHFNIWITVVAAVVFALIGWWLAQRISLPIRELTHTADRLACGEEVDIPSRKSFSDIEMLSSSLQTMVTSLSQKEVELGNMQSLAHYDHLTGLPNRNALETYLEDAFEDPEQQPCLSFLYIDLDGFKKVNDTLGHQSGDILLQKVAQRLSQLKREHDITVRLGGDEFLVVLHTDPSGLNIEKEAEIYANEIIRSLNKPFIVEYEKVNIGCSIGGAVYPHDSDNPIEIIRMADQALYQSKRSGKNRLTFYKEPLAPQSIG
ncbi:sensor domain-containing diguanylate cyclase [Paenibacillus sp. CFBP13512]|uniref:sensor domain-containing diguanylate cyclase n=1 Tax=Paenibacillus sp. CFBP13512 TaxID=2184007 RepID=UPI001F4F3030|nr:sensor domain-containing diguanylate cyclase [Paenibacillus sp. CFBP13512]